MNKSKKQLISNKHISKPVIVYSYDDSEKGSKILSRCNAIINAIGDILKKDVQGKILILGRYNFDKNMLIDTNMFKEKPQDKLICKTYPEANITFQTVHKAKGLEFDYVIIINAIDSKYGFPSKVNDDPVFKIFENETKEISNVSYAEERRLFYVALTRTKNHVSIIVPRLKPSPFVLEIKDNIQVDFKDDVINFYYNKLEKNRCPKCNSFLKYGFSNIINDFVYYCTTETEACGFLTKTLNPKINMIKCPNCNDGYLFYKVTTINGKYMLGCTNYNNNEKNDSCNFVVFVDPKDIKNGSFSNYECKILK